MKKKILLAIGIALVLVIRIVAGGMCILKNTVGLPCPACGMTRAYYALLKGNMQAAFSYHPLFWSVPIIGILVLVIKKLRSSRMFWWIVAGAFLAVFAVRMFLYFPDTPPLDYNSGSQLARIYFFIKNMIEELRI